jgi:hypothetical protein
MNPGTARNGNAKHGAVKPNPAKRTPRKPRAVRNAPAKGKRPVKAISFLDCLALGLFLARGFMS